VTYPRKTPATNRIDLTGQRFGMLVVTGETETRGKTLFWRCRCDCGGERWTRAQTLRQTATNCGCQPNPSRAGVGRVNLTHGKSKTRTYRSWLGMRARCKDPTNADYYRRGISVCARWDRSFEAFLEDMGECPLGMSIEREDNDRGYEPGNCRWATRVEQAQNRRVSLNVTAHGRTLNLAEWSRLTGVKYATLRKRLFQFGWEPERAIPDFEAVGRE
jgi:hypothetical protein